MSLPWSISRIQGLVSSCFVAVMGEQYLHDSIKLLEEQGSISCTTKSSPLATFSHTHIQEPLNTMCKYSTSMLLSFVALGYVIDLVNTQRYFSSNVLTIIDSRRKAT
jgi:hypothetical protein